MPAISADPEAARHFAIEVVQRLREAGHEALWAGGCVRDELLGRTPADYDVATSAKPDEVRGIFGHRRTLAVGAAFGVITVVGRRGSGHVEVTTFRTDAAYTDGRHPAGVTFATAEEDALRRDFSINGLFFDPITGEVHDFVGGRDDLAAGIVRAIGVPSQRFAEDHLRLLRAVRFAAVFGFVLESHTRAAVERMAGLVTSVSPERIAAELRLMVARPGRGRALELLAETGLAMAVLPEVGPAAGPQAAEAWPASVRVIDALDEPALPQAIAALVEGACGPREGDPRARHPIVNAISRRLRLSNDEAATASWLLAALAAIGEDDVAALRGRAWSSVQPWLADRRRSLLVDLLRARAQARRGEAAAAAWATAESLRPIDRLDPPPLLGGDELLAEGVAKGRPIGEMLACIRRMQLDGLLANREAALEWVRARGDRTAAADGDETAAG